MNKMSISFVQSLLPLEQKRKLEFGISQESYKTAKRILEMRPFAQFPGTKYRYFYAQGWNFRIEQGKQFRVKAPEPLIAYLTWFFRVKDFCELAHLRETKSKYPVQISKVSVVSLSKFGFALGL
jgi:hypothetical protein